MMQCPSPAIVDTSRMQSLDDSVMCVREVARAPLLTLLTRFGLTPEAVPVDTEIPGSYWGEREAGLVGSRIHFRDDTPLQSLLHEASHYICMDAARRAALHKDAGGDFDEENAVCYLQILLADQVMGFGRERMLHDMDAWGYTFRLGSAKAWFESEADAARQWLLREGLIDASSQPTGQLRR